MNKNSHIGDKGTQYKIKAIYDRIKNCDDCYHDPKFYLDSTNSGAHGITDHGWVFFSDEMLLDFSKKAICLQNYKFINDNGIVRISPEIARHIMSALVR